MEREAELGSVLEMAGWCDAQAENDVDMVEDHNVEAAYAWEEEASGYASPR